MNGLLSWLLAGHMVGDYLFQTRWMATQKTKLFSALAIHAAIYACAIWLVSLPAGGLSPLSVLFLFLTHAVVDRRDITLWWCKYVTQSQEEWLFIMTDQAMHIVVLVLACLLERRIKGW